MSMFFFYKRRISPVTLTLFTRQLAILLHAGLTLLRGLEILAEQESNRFFKQIILELIGHIESGTTLSESLAAYPSVFSRLYVNMVRAGEASGTLAIVLSRLVSYQEKMQHIKNKMTSILLYPALLLMITLVMILFLADVIIPKFEAIFADELVEGTLPPLTHIVLEASQYGRSHIITIATLIILALIVIKVAWSLEFFCNFIDRFLFKLPLLGQVLQKQLIAQCFSTLGTLMLHSVPPLEALRITETISSNRAIAKAIKMIHDSLQAGDSLLYPLQASRLFPPAAISMVAVGEETGRLPDMLLQVATIYEQEVEHRTAQLMILMEPCLILVLACLIGTVVIALFLPLMTMMGSLGN